MIFVTGDTHIPLDYAKIFEPKLFGEETLTKKDYLIVCGDFGGVWGNGRGDNFYLDKVNNLPFTTLFVDGNHENYTLLKKYKQEVWNGGKVQFIKEHIIHLMRGEVYNIEGTKIFTFGGANSTDKLMRVNGLSWWTEEMPSLKEYKNGIDNLKRNNNEVDYIISHTAPYNINDKYFKKGLKDEKKLGEYLENINRICKYKHHYFGHFHKDMKIDDKHTLLYNKIKKIK